jgi:hypothetical protein
MARRTANDATSLSLHEKVLASIKEIVTAPPALKEDVDAVISAMKVGQERAERLLLGALQATTPKNAGAHHAASYRLQFEELLMPTPSTESTPVPDAGTSLKELDLAGVYARLEADRLLNPTVTAQLGQQLANLREGQAVLRKTDLTDDDMRVVGQSMVNLRQCADQLHLQVKPVRNFDNSMLFCCVSAQAVC